MTDASSRFTDFPVLIPSQDGPYSTNGTILTVVPAIFPYFHITYSNIMKPTDEGLRGLHCSQWLNAREGQQFAFWFQTFYVEETYDNVTVYNTATLETVKIQPGHIYVAAAPDILLQFDSDGSITQAGFEVFIREYECLYENITVTIPCSGTVNTTFLKDFHNPHMFCSDQDVYINYEMEEECGSETQYIAVHYNLTQNSIIGGTVISPKGPFSLIFTRMLIRTTFGIFVSTDSFFGILDTTDISFSLIQYRIPEPKLIDALMLNETVTYAFYDLARITDNSYIEIRNNLPGDMLIDYFFVTDTHYGVLDFYIGFFDSYDAPLESIDNGFESINRRQFVPHGLDLDDNMTLIYTEKQDKTHNAFMFVRIHDLEISNCLFEHNVIDAKSLAEVNGTLTMVNNGTGACTVTLLNPFREKRICLDQFWTDSSHDPIEVHDEEELLFTFTKFDKIEQFYLEKNFYRFILPPRTSFTVIGYDNQLK